MVQTLVPESVLKKRRTLEEIQAKRAADAVASKKAARVKKGHIFRRAEKYVKEYKQVFVYWYIRITLRFETINGAKIVDDANIVATLDSKLWMTTSLFTKIAETIIATKIVEKSLFSRVPYFLPKLFFPPFWRCRWRSKLSDFAARQRSLVIFMSLLKQKLPLLFAFAVSSESLLRSIPHLSSILDFYYPTPSSTILATEEFEWTLMSPSSLGSWWIG